MKFHDPNKRAPELYDEKLRELLSLSLEHIKCVVCGADAPVPVCIKNGLQVVECTSCGHVYVNPRPPTSAVRLIYDESYWMQFQPSIGSPSLPERCVFDYNNAIAKLQRDVLRFKTAGSFLDIGCSNGALVKRAEELGFEAMGLEVDERVAAFARRTFGVKVSSGLLKEQRFDAESFDVITLYDVLEHLFEPRIELEEVFRILRPGGLFVVETVNTDSLNFRADPGKWTSLEPVEHMDYFSEANLLTILEGIGFCIIQSRCPHEDNIVVLSTKR